MFVHVDTYTMVGDESCEDAEEEQGTGGRDEVHIKRKAKMAA